MKGARVTPLARRLSTFGQPRRRSPLASLFADVDSRVEGRPCDNGNGTSQVVAAVSDEGDLSCRSASNASLHDPVVGNPESGETPDAATQKVTQQALLAAFAEGRRAGLMEARAGFEAQLARLRAEFGMRLQAERRSMQKTLADGLARALQERIDSGLVDVERNVAAILAEVLRPVLAEAALDQALSQLAAQLDRLLREDEGIDLRVRGPEVLVRALKARLKGRLRDEACTVDETMADIEVDVHDTAIRTGLAMWAQTLRATMPATEGAEGESP